MPQTTFLTFEKNLFFLLIDRQITSVVSIELWIFGLAADLPAYRATVQLPKYSYDQKDPRHFELTQQITISNRSPPTVEMDKLALPAAHEQINSGRLRKLDRLKQFIVYYRLLRAALNYQLFTLRPGQEWSYFVRFAPTAWKMFKGNRPSREVRIGSFVRWLGRFSKNTPPGGGGGRDNFLKKKSRVKTLDKYTGEIGYVDWVALSRRFGVLIRSRGEEKGEFSVEGTSF